LIRRIKLGGWKEKNFSNYERTRNTNEMCSSYPHPFSYSVAVWTVLVGSQSRFPWSAQPQYMPSPPTLNIQLRCAMSWLENFRLLSTVH